MASKTEYLVLTEKEIPVDPDDAESEETETVYSIALTTEANGDDHARRIYLEANPEKAGEPLVVVPSSMWHKKKATPRTIYSYEDA